MKLHNSHLFLTILLMSSACLAQDQAVIETARNLHKAHENAIITISATVKITMEGGPPGVQFNGDESRSEVSATVIDASGLAVTSMRGLNPAMQMPDQKANIGGQTATLKFKGQVSEIKLRLPDGTEVPARIVLRDDDLDLAFIAPLQSLSDADRAKVSPISLADAAKELDLLDPLIEVARLSKDMNYQSSVHVGRVSAKLRTPRTLYLGASTTGCPAFDSTGKLIGITLRHHHGTEDHGGGPSFLGAAFVNSPVIVPAADIADLASQAKEEMGKPAKEKAIQPASGTPAASPGPGANK